MRNLLWATRRARLRSLLAGATLAAALVVWPLYAEHGFGASEKYTTAWDISGFEEPSAIVYDPSRNSLFVIGDEGDIGEVSVDGKLLRSRHLGGDFEGVTRDPSSDRLYVVREGHELIYEVRPSDFSITRRFAIDRTFEGNPDYLQRGGDGIEGLTFVPDPTSKEGGRFFAVNQYDPPVLVELAVPIRSSKEKFATATIVSARPVEDPPLSDVVWDPAIDGFVIPNALWRKAYVTDKEGRYLRSVRLPALMPEGIAFLPGGKFVIAQDSGGLVLWTPPSDPFAPTAAAPSDQADEPRPTPAGAGHQDSADSGRQASGDSGKQEPAASQMPAPSATAPGQAKP